MTAPLHLQIDRRASQLQEPSPVVVLVHGFPGGAEDWGPVLERLTGDFTVVVPDLLGFGRSPRPEAFADLWVDSQAAALAVALDDAGVRDAVVVGHDLGGPVTALLATTRPDLVAGVVFASCNLRADRAVPGVFKLIPRPVVGRLVARVFMSGPAMRGIARAGTRTGGRRPVRNDRREVVAIRTIFATALADYQRWFGPVQAAAEALRIPRVVVWGDDDPFFSVDHAHATAAGMQDAPLRLYHGGHFPQLEAPDAVVDAIREVTAGASSVR